MTRIETVAMTTTEYEDAVEALAILIARYWDHHPGTSTPDRKMNGLHVGMRQRARAFRRPGLVRTLWDQAAGVMVTV
ncbi:MAG TPA: hypothetical protein VF070_10865 [Streptosporangiaceae bacterium]